MEKNTLRKFIIPILGIIVLGFNMSIIENSECIRMIHIVTLLVMGIFVGILGMNIIEFLRKKP